MQFERLRKSHKKQIIIGAIAVCVIGGALTFSLTRAKYEINGDLELTKGTINYKAYDFKIMAIYKSDDKANYTEIEAMPSEGYTINEDKSYCNMSNGNKDTTAILKTIDGNHSISKLKKNDRCYLYFDKKITASEIILANLGTDIKTTTPDFSQTAELDEGVFITDDPMYGANAKTYYWRGAVTNNYVKFANFCWRIIRINGDGTLRLIYDGSICHNNGESTADSIAIARVKYSALWGNSSYVGWTYVEGKQRPEAGDTEVDSDAKTELETWYEKNITKTDASKLADGKFCNDRNIASGYVWGLSPTKMFYYATYERVIDRRLSLSCDVNDVYTLKVGLITTDEAMYAGGGTVANKAYYLYNGERYWTMSPSYWGGNAVTMYVMSMIGRPDDPNGLNNTSPGLRPVINLRSDVIFSGGDGTLNNPYIVAD